MWIFHTAGFISAVQHRDDHSKVMVRARDRLSLESLLMSTEESFVESGFSKEAAKAVVADIKIYAVVGDYKWRLVMPKSMFALAMVQEVMQYINYDNFKSKLTETRGDKYHDVAMKIWSAAHGLTDTVKTGVEAVDNPKWERYAPYHFDASKGGRFYDTAEDFVGSTFFEPYTPKASEDDDLPTDQEIIDIRDIEEGLYSDAWEVWNDGTLFNTMTGETRLDKRFSGGGGIMSLTDDAYREMTDAEYEEYTENAGWVK